MRAKAFKYNVVTRKEGKYFVAYVPALGISDFGRSLREANRNVKNAIECHVEGLAKTLLLNQKRLKEYYSRMVSL